MYLLTEALSLNAVLQIQPFFADPGPTFQFDIDPDRDSMLRKVSTLTFYQ
jgi:hypothetical protein